MVTYDKFDSISKGGVEEATKGLTQLDGDFFSSKREDRSQGDDCEEVESEDSGSTPIEHASNNPKRYEDKQHIHIT